MRKLGCYANALALSKVVLTFEKVHILERSPLRLNVGGEVIHLLVAVLDLIQVGRVCALPQPEQTQRRHTAEQPEANRS